MSSDLQSLDVHFRLSEPAVAKVTFFDSDFRPVRAYVMEKLESGVHTVRWDGKDEHGTPTPPEAYWWKIEAGTSSGTETWEPAGVYSRVIEHVTGHEWNAPTRVISYSISAPMRVWVRVGIWLGAYVRGLVEGEPRPAGAVNEGWDGLDETGLIEIASERKDWVVSVFGYRLPQPCVIVTGAGPLPVPSADRHFLSLLSPPVAVGDAAWQRRRAFTLGDRWRPVLRVVQLDKATFRAELEVPEEFGVQGAAVLQRMLADRIRLKWFIDGHCAGEDVDAVLPSMITLSPDQIPNDGERHFITANVVTAMHEAAGASLWIQ